MPPERRRIDLARAKLDPASVFRSPDEVVSEPSLSRAEKIRILEQWEYDVRELEVAEEENMPGPTADCLNCIRAALRRLGGRLDLEGGPPTKHGGIGVAL